MAGDGEDWKRRLLGDREELDNYEKYSRPPKTMEDLWSGNYELRKPRKLTWRERRAVVKADKMLGRIVHHGWYEKRHKERGIALLAAVIAALILGLWFKYH